MRARMGYYTTRCHPGVRNAVIYWHYLGAVWVLLLGLMLLDR